MALTLLVAAGCGLALSGVPGLLMPWRSTWGPRVATAAVLLAAALGIAGAAAVLGGAPTSAFAFAPGAPGIRLTLGVDALSAFFAVPVLVVGGLGSIYGLGYRPAADKPRNGRRLRFCYGLLLGGMLFVTLARDGASFLVAWEVMALSGYFLVTTESRRPGVREAGWLFLVYSHAGTLAIAGFFAVLAGASGDLSLRNLAAGEIDRGFAWVAFALAVFGFGIKAGAMPLHSWLPSAHASAPSHVSAVMSGVLLKMGVYGLLRATAVLPPGPSSWGAALLVLGGLSALLAITFALAQGDLKRLLAYSSIENVGIILLGLGLALVGRSTGRSDWVLLGMAGCLFHVWNHALFKSLLFFGAGSVVHATGTREIDRMGGLARRMPATAALFLAGSIAICGLPPLNGFASELMVYLGFARAAVGPGAAWVALPAPVLAATGALAVACFVKVVGIVFLGTPRSDAAARAHEAPRAMLAPMAMLAALCALLGVAPMLVAPALERATAVWAGGPLPGGPLTGGPLAALVPFGWVSAGAAAIVALSGLLALALLPANRRARRRQPDLPTWDCGYAAGSPRLQYTGSSFAEIVTSRFAWALRPREQRPVIDRFFPAGAAFHSHVDDTVLDRFLRPRVERVRRAAARVRAYQHGNLQQYVLYIVVAIAALLFLNLRFDWVANELCGR
jgi:hydrogenase-4 component B